MTETLRRGGKKGRKLGRKKMRSAAQARYRSACGGRGRCYLRKVKNLVRHNSMTMADAKAFMDRVYDKRGQRLKVTPDE
jgi:hypothetical protein